MRKAYFYNSPLVLPMNLLTGLTFFSSLSFLFFGLGCLYDSRMKAEFIRYHLENKRRLTGFLQITGSLGLVAGWAFCPLLAMISATGLAILMLLGFGVRIKIKDSWLQSSPSLIYSILNAYLAINYLEML